MKLASIATTPTLAPAPLPEAPKSAPTPQDKVELDVPSKTHWAPVMRAALFGGGAGLLVSGAADIASKFGGAQALHVTEAVTSGAAGVGGAVYAGNKAWDSVMMGTDKDNSILGTFASFFLMPFGILAAGAGGAGGAAVTGLATYGAEALSAHFGLAGMLAATGGGAMLGAGLEMLRQHIDNTP